MILPHTYSDPCFSPFFFFSFFFDDIQHIFISFFPLTTICKSSQWIDELAVVVAQSSDVFFCMNATPVVLFKQACAPVIVVVANKQNKIM
jgi:hypothetical protein